MGYCRVENGIVAEVFPFNPFEWIPNDSFLSTCMKCPDTVQENFLYENGTFKNPNDKTPKEKRESAYEIDKIVSWEESTLTVDEANKIYLEYSAEANEKAAQIQTLIKTAKETIREMYPDE